MIGALLREPTQSWLADLKRIWVFQSEQHSAMLQSVVIFNSRHHALSPQEMFEIRNSPKKLPFCRARIV